MLKKIMLILITVLFSVACVTSADSSRDPEYSGTVEDAGMTTYMYGTHILIVSNQEYYALTSQAVNLTEFEGQNVVIRAAEVDGYPVDGGPVYLEVTEIRVQ